MAMTALLQLIKCGQSYWLDNLTRRKITSGELNKRVVLQGLRGVTSNPAIFDKAISGGDDYDAQLQQLVHAGCEVHEIYERLVISDIQDACDILRPVYDGSDGEDGFVSLEVSPYLAPDTAETMAEARHFGTPSLARTFASRSRHPGGRTCYRGDAVRRYQYQHHFTLRHQRL